MGKELMVLRGEIKTPPLSHAARRQIGYLLRGLQEGESLSMPHSRPIPDIGPRCHELRVNDEGKRGGLSTGLTWTRFLYRMCSEEDTGDSGRIIEDCRRRLRLYDEIIGE